MADKLPKKDEIEPSATAPLPGDSLPNLPDYGKLLDSISISNLPDYGKLLDSISMSNLPDYGKLLGSISMLMVGYLIGSRGQLPETWFLAGVSQGTPS
jgi:hypothetical protein